MSFIHNFGKTSHIEVNVGGRQHIYMNRFRNFAGQLKRAGAKLVFICDGHLRSDRLAEWCKRREKEFRQTYAMVTTSSQLQTKCSFGCKTIVSSLFKIIEDEQLGKIIISTHAECDAIVASYANKHNALAVIGDDSDFLIYGGNFSWWQSSSLSMYQFTIRSFDRLQLHRYFSLSCTQMKYLATTAGNDHTKHIVQEHDGNSRASTDFVTLASFCRSLTPEKSEAVICQQIARYMRSNQGQMRTSDLEYIRRSIESYCVDIEQPIFISRLMSFYQKNFLQYALKYQQVLQVPANFLDFAEHTRTKKQTLMAHIIGVYRRIAGILLPNTTNEPPKLTIATKHVLFEEYALKSYDPIYPQSMLEFLCNFIFV